MMTASGNHWHAVSGSIRGVVTAVPREVVTNDDCPDPKAAQEAAKVTGVQARRWVADGQTTAGLCLAAARELLPRLKWEPVSLDLIVYVTQTPEQKVPADVYAIAAELGASCPCVQVNWSCSGYVAGLWLAMSLMQPQGGRSLLLVGDVSSGIMDPSDRATAPLFGDAGSATAIEGDWPAQHFFLGSDGSGANKLAQGPAGFLTMDGADVFGFTLKRVPGLVRDVLEQVPSPDALLFHQANRMMLEHLTKKAVPEPLRARVPMNIERFGNCSSASIPLLMCSTEGARDWRRVAMLGFGAGWAWAGAAIQLPALSVCELLEV